MSDLFCPSCGHALQPFRETDGTIRWLCMQRSCASVQAREARDLKTIEEWTMSVEMRLRAIEERLGL